jgi:hypothetical protein
MFKLEIQTLTDIKFLEFNINHLITHVIYDFFSGKLNE